MGLSDAERVLDRARGARPRPRRRRRGGGRPRAGRAGAGREGAVSEATERPVAAGTARLLISCPDQPGIVAAVSGFLFRHGANIVSSDQHSTDPEGGRFFMRMEFSTTGMDLDGEELEAAFRLDVAERFEMDWRMTHPGEHKRMAILASRYEHCLLDLLWRWRRGELDAEISLVASNHPDLADDVGGFGVPYHHVPV